MKNEKVTDSSSEVLNLSDSECRLLYKTAKKVAKNEVIIEIGNHFSNSTQWLAKGAQEGNQCQLYNMQSRFDVDEQTEEGDGTMENNVHLDNEYKTELDSASFSYVDSDETTRRWKEKIGLLCLNVCRTYDDMYEIITGWERHLSSKASVIIFNCNTTDAAKIIKNKTGNTGKYVIEKMEGELALIRSDKCVHHWLLDSSDYGICKHCNRTRNFRKMLKESRSFDTRRRKRAANRV
jgi:hypothetical protein